MSKKPSQIVILESAGSVTDLKAKLNAAVAQANADGYTVGHIMTAHHTAPTSFLVASAIANLKVAATRKKKASAKK